MVCYVPSGKFFARIRVRGRLIRRSLKTSTFSVAKLRLADLEKTERQMAEHAKAFEAGKMTFGNALKEYRRGLLSNPSLKPRTRQHREERISVLLKTWAELEDLDVRKINRQDCQAWAENFKSGASNFNKTVQTFRAVMAIAVEAGVRYDNPAAFIKLMKIRQKNLQLPSRAQFQLLLTSVRGVRRRFRACLNNQIFRIGARFTGLSAGARTIY